MSGASGVPGAFALVLHYTDDEEHAFRTFDALKVDPPTSYEPREIVAKIKKAALVTRLAKLLDADLDRRPIV